MFPKLIFAFGKIDFKVVCILPFEPLSNKFLLLVKLFIDGVDEALLLTDDEADELVDVELEDDVDDEENFDDGLEKPGGGTIGF